MNSAYSQQSSNIRTTWVLILVFVGLVSAVCYSISLYYNNYAIALLGLGLSLTQAGSAYWFGDKIALHTARAKEVNEQEAPDIHVLVENLSKIAGIPKPKVFISPDPSPNAFATGRNPKHASICLNQGIITLLNKSELEGVIAHELSHIRNRDILLMTTTMVLASVITVITDLSFRLAFFGGNRSRDDKNNNSPILLIIYFATLVLAPFIALIIQLAVSRSRESLADASAVVLTRYPQGLISALQKLYNSPTASTTYASSMSHFYIAPPKRYFGQDVKTLFSTHPSIDERIKALEKM